MPRMKSDTCKNGHSEWRVWPDGHRRCAECRRETNRRQYAANPEMQRKANLRWRVSHQFPVFYMYFDSSGMVIYVGRGGGRRPHRLGGGRESWWPEVAKIRTRRCKTWADSLVLEALFIRKYQPKYNSIGVTR